MSVHNLDSIFRPERIALFGASENPTSVGCTVLGNLVGSGFRGVVYPVNPTREAVPGHPCYTDDREPAATSRPGGDLHAGRRGARHRAASAARRACWDW